MDALCKVHDDMRNSDVAAIIVGENDGVWDVVLQSLVFHGKWELVL